jgi:hypothetical protein
MQSSSVIEQLNALCEVSEEQEQIIRDEIAKKGDQSLSVVFLKELINTLHILDKKNEKLAKENSKISTMIKNIKYSLDKFKNSVDQQHIEWEPEYTRVRAT